MFVSWFIYYLIIPRHFSKKIDLEILNLEILKVR